MRPRIDGYPLHERFRTRIDTLRLPSRESAFVVGSDGRLLPGTAISACRSNNGARLDVSERGYFTKALEGETRSLPVPPHSEWAKLELPSGERREGRERADRRPSYTIEEVRSQSDGIDKTIIAWPAVFDQTAYAAKAPDAVVVSAAVLRSLLVPVLPPGERFMVVDLATPGLDVLFHSDRQRVHFETVRNELHSAKLDGVLTLLRGEDAAAQGPPALTSMYDGTRQHFGLARLPFAEWAVLAWHSNDGADRIPAQVLLASMMSFSGAVLAVWGLPLLVLGVTGRLRWGWLWPDARRAASYARLAEAFALIAAIGGLALAVLPGIPLWIALAMWLGGLAAALLVWRRASPGPVEPLGPVAGRAYARAALAALAAIIVVRCSPFTPTLRASAAASSTPTRRLR